MRLGLDLSVAGIGGVSDRQPFAGYGLKLDADKTGISLSGNYDVVWDSIDWQHGVTDIGSAPNPPRLTAPAGATLVRVSFGYLFSSHTTGSDPEGHLIIRDGGTDPFPAFARVQYGHSSHGRCIQCIDAPPNPGTTYYVLRVGTSDTSVTQEAENSYATMEVLV